MVRFGILGTARIARAFLGYPLDGAEIVAIASRDLDRARKFAEEFHIPKAYGSYDDLLSDADIDAVYIPLPQHLHCEYTFKSASVGKHVLVEKPAALNADEMHRMIQTCEDHDVLLMEGFMYRFMSIHKRAKEIIREGTIGALRYIDFNFCFHIVARGRTGFRLMKETGGGALYDLGVYGLDFIRYVTDGEPSLLYSFTQVNGATGVDEFTHAVFKIGSVVGSVTCAFTTDANYYILSGEKGSITSPVGISGRNFPNLLRIHLLEGDEKYEEHFAAENPYKAEIEHFAGCVADGKTPMLTVQSSLRNLELLDQLRKRSAPM